MEKNFVACFNADFGLILGFCSNNRSSFYNVVFTDRVRATHHLEPSMSAKQYTTMDTIAHKHAMRWSVQLCTFHAMQRGAKITKDTCLDVESVLSFDFNSISFETTLRLTGASDRSSGVGHSWVVERILRCEDHIIVGYVPSHTCGEMPPLTRRSPVQN